MCRRAALSSLIFLVLQPGLLVVDHGHFQYNGVSLGEYLLSLSLV